MNVSVRNMPRRFFILLSLFGLTLLVTIFVAIQSTTARVTFQNGPIVHVEIERTEEDRERGLAGHLPLDDAHGMLFVWGYSGQQSFWMKGMTFPIDILWLRDGVVIGMVKNASIPSENELSLPTYTSPGPVDAVLEVAAGFIDRYHITAEQTVQY